jgi:hypothetical protein
MAWLAALELADAAIGSASSSALPWEDGSHGLRGRTMRTSDVFLRVALMPEK